MLGFGAGIVKELTPLVHTAHAVEVIAPETCTLQRLAARQGFEPRYAAPEAAVLPLNDRAVPEF